MVLLLLLPGALAVWLGFEAGGYFARHTAAAVVVVGLAFAARLLLSDRPLAGFSRGAGLAALLLVALGAWTAASGGWSDAPGRAAFEAVRVALYLAVLVLLASLPRRDGGIRWLVRGLLAAFFAVALCALITRLLPDVWPTTPSIENQRLAFPLTYWNALGLLTAMGVLLALGVSGDPREGRAVRIAAAGAVPVFAATMLFTFSRGSVAVTAVGLVVLVVAARSRSLLGALLSLPASALALAACLSADALTSNTPTSAAAVEQGEQVAVVVVIAVLAAMALRWLADLRIDARPRPADAPRRLPALPTGPRLYGGVAAVLLAVVAVGLAAGGAGVLDRQWDRFTKGDHIATSDGDLRERFINPGNNGRIEQWRAAWRGFESAPARGTGAGTYALLWDRHRESDFEVEDAHSLYLETAAELGLIGLALLVALLLVVLVAIGRRCRGPERVPYAAAFAAAVAWALHAGLDWDWELPAVTLGLFAAGGIALARAPAADRPPLRVPLALRAAGALGVAGVLFVPLALALSDHDALKSKRAFARGDCAAASRLAADAIGALDVRPEPHEIRGYCAVRSGDTAAGVAAMRAAVAKDPQNWRVHYGLSLALAADRRDPRPAIGRARDLNPVSPLAFETAKSFWKTQEPGSWRRRALAAGLPSD